MMLYPTNSADRRQQPCTTTIRSRRAHPRHVLDTAALNAYVPNNVGSKSHNELTWNHVVSVFTFFGLLMTALVSLCCWSHFQFIVERRRLAANTEFNSQHRRLVAEEVTVSGPDEPVTGKYTKAAADAVPEWYTNEDVKQYFKGGTDYETTSNSITWTPQKSCTECVNPKSAGEHAGKYFDKAANKGAGEWIKYNDQKPLRANCKNCDKTGKIPEDPVTAARNKEGWKKITGGRRHYVNGDCIIFFCAIQNKWHMCGANGIYYRNNDGRKSKTEPLPKSGWNSHEQLGADKDKESAKKEKISY